MLSVTLFFRSKQLLKKWNQWSCSSDWVKILKYIFQEIWSFIIKIISTVHQNNEPEYLGHKDLKKAFEVHMKVKKKSEYGEN